MSGLDFNLTEQQWDAASAELERLGRLRWEGDRQEIELECSLFVLSRQTYGKSSRRPSDHVKAWKSVSSSAQRLDRAINGLDPIRAAQFDVLNMFEGIDSDNFRKTIPKIAEAALVIAYMEGQQSATATAGDDQRDHLIESLIRFWIGAGGKRSVSTTRDGRPAGPLLRFLSVTARPAIEAVGMSVSDTALREAIRKNRRSAASDSGK